MLTFNVATAKVASVRSLYANMPVPPVLLWTIWMAKVGRASAQAVKVLVGVDVVRIEELAAIEEVVVVVGLEEVPKEGVQIGTTKGNSIPQCMAR